MVGNMICRSGALAAYANARVRCLCRALHKQRYEYNKIMNSARAERPGTRISAGFAGFLVQ
jgi:hypothetical protein